MTKKTAGRNSKLNENEVNKVIKLFREQEQPAGVIKYADIHRFANELFEQGIIPASTSDAFWRKDGRLGRTIVDKANLVFSDTVLTSKGEELVIPDSLDLIEKKYKDKEALTKHMLFMEKQLRESLEREKKLKEKLIKAEESIQEEKNKRNKSDESNEELQGLVYSLYRILSDVSDPMVKEKVVYAMETVFSDPVSFLKNEEYNEKTNEKIVPLQTTNENKKKLSNKFRK
ncbi:hypothetical protein SFC65_20065 [Priestia filamentosa]|uniref:hypothetical protein n=1 Tax=Priestia filamentosa TaxID=1402861 RepID=UPI0039826103